MAISKILILVILGVIVGVPFYLLISSRIFCRILAFLGAIFICINETIRKAQDEFSAKKPSIDLFKVAYRHLYKSVGKIDVIFSPIFLCMSIFILFCILIYRFLKLLYAGIKFWKDGMLACSKSLLEGWLKLLKYCLEVR